MTTTPAIRYALPLTGENRWSDMLAVLIATDPELICHLLRLDVDPATVDVRREVKADGGRLDIVLEVSGLMVSVIEVKVLNGLGSHQLSRYEKSAPSSARLVVVHPDRLTVDTGHAPLWRRITWEQLLSEYAHSDELWVSTCASAWLSHLDAALPKVDRGTVWNDLPSGSDFVLAMRTRISWLFSAVNPAVDVASDLVESTAGVSSVLRMYAPCRRAGYSAGVEVEERLGVRDYPKYAHADQRKPVGPSVLVALTQHDVDTSAGFDWGYLRHVWDEAMAPSRDDWVRNPPGGRRAEIDKHNYQQMVADGGPRHLGVGFGDGQAKRWGSCLFGARIQYPATITLGTLAEEIIRLSELVKAMAQA